MATGTLHYGITQTDLEDRVSAEVVRQILDDDNDGTADTNPVLRLLLDAQSYVESYLRTVFKLDELRAQDPVDNEIVRMILCRAEGQLYIRHPEHARFDAGKALDRLDKEILRFVANGQRGLDNDAHTALNQGGIVSTMAADNNFPDPPKVIFGAGFGFF
jgi:phage gp36-like protein